MSPVNRIMRINKGLVILILIGMAVQMSVVIYFVTEFRDQSKKDVVLAETLRQRDVKRTEQARMDLVVSTRAACERGKKDRRDNADFQKAQAKYITRVTGAASVREDVKRAAREARKTFERTSESLAIRAKIDCTQAFP